MLDLLKKLYIEPTSHCNLSCTMCFRKTWIDEVFGHMTRSDFDRVMDTMPSSVEKVFFGGMGEPLFHRDILYMVQTAASKGKMVELLTNGTLLTQEMSAELLDAGLTGLWVSIDSFEASRYENIRQNSNFSLIKNHITRFNLERAKREDCPATLGVAFVAMKSNVAQLGELAHFAYENQVNHVNVSNVIPTDEASQKESLYTRLLSLELYTQEVGNVHPNINLPMMDSHLAEVREGLLGLYSSDANLQYNNVPLMRRKKFCRFVEEGNAFVRHDGDISPCMALLHSAATYLDGNQRIVHHHAFGNIRTTGLGESWNSHEYSDFRRRVRGFEFSPCMHCGGCDNRDDNLNDCLGNMKPTCGACLWSEGIISCP